VALSFAVEDKGILPDRMIAALAASGAILPETDFVPGQIQPASLDLRLGAVAYRVRASFLPGVRASLLIAAVVTLAAAAVSRLASL